MKKYPYFPDGEGLSRRTADLTEQMRVIAYRYMGDNVPFPYTLRRMPEDFFRQEGAGTYVIDLQEKLGSGRDGYAFAAGLVHSHAETVIPVSLGCMSPCWIWLNGEQIYASTFRDETWLMPAHQLKVTLKKGDNILHILSRRTAAGFGCRISLPPIPVLSPLPGADGAAGWVWTDLLDKVTDDLLTGVFSALLSLSWNPGPEAGKTDSQSSHKEKSPEGSFIAWSKLTAPAGARVQAKIKAALPGTLFADGQPVCSFTAGETPVTLSGSFPMDLHLTGNAVLVLSEEGRAARLSQPVPVQGSKSVWLYADFEEPFDYDRYTSVTWTDWLGTRLFYEGAFSNIDWVKQGGNNFGSWNYPVGVTLQGLLRASELAN